MNTAIRAVADENSSHAIKSNCVWLPGIGQTCRGGWPPGSPPDKTLQGKDTEAVVGGITNEEIAFANANTVRIASCLLPEPLPPKQGTETNWQVQGSKRLSVSVFLSSK